MRAFSLDLHVLGTPPAFVLSQDQTLQLRIRFPSAFLARRSRLQGRARQCTQSIAVSAIPSWTCYPVFRDRPTPSYCALPTAMRSAVPSRPTERARYVPPSAIPVKSRDQPALADPFRLQGSRCLAEPPEAVKKRLPMTRLATAAARPANPGTPRLPSAPSVAWRGPRPRMCSDHVHLARSAGDRWLRAGHPHG